MNTGRTRIFVTFTRTGFHRWPDAPLLRAYLAAPHRHVFHFRVELDVHHDNREIEFHDLLDTCTAVIDDYGEDWDSCSCEAIARRLLADVQDQYPGTSPLVTVSEDGECGATVC